MSVAKAHVKKALGKDIHAKEYQTMSPSEILSARMTKASYINLTEGSHAAQAYANAHIPGFRLDHSLTTEHQSVFYNKETGELRLAYRGTQAGRDWASKFKMGVGATQYASQARELEKSMQRVIAKYGTNGKLPPNTVISGHSKRARGAGKRCTWRRNTA